MRTRYKRPQNVFLLSGKDSIENLRRTADVPFASTTFTAVVSKSMSESMLIKEGGHLPLPRTLSRILIVKVSIQFALANLSRQFYCVSRNMQMMKNPIALEVSAFLDEFAL